MQPQGQVVIAIVGPTCTGKTSLSLELAKKLDGEIVACDSRTIYKRMDIGTAKPSQAEQSLIPHHAIDVLEPNRFYSVAEYKELAQHAVKDILNRGKLPIICGGTGLYARALLEGIDIPAIPPQPQLREHLNAMASEKGNLYLHEKLKALDPVSAGRLSVNDRRRIIRALEVSMVSGKAFSDLSVRGSVPFKTIWIGLYLKNRTLHKQMIIERLKQQFADGLENEVVGLFAQPEFNEVLCSAVNYKEFLPYIDGKENLEYVLEQCVLHNFQLARKQMTWFKANKEIRWYELDSISQENMLSGVIDFYQTITDKPL